MALFDHFTKKSGGFSDTGIRLFSQTAENDDDVRKKAKEVRFLKGNCNNFVSPPVEREGFIERAKASWNEDTKNWDIRHIRITHLNGDMAEIARSLENDELMPAPVICSTPHLFDALYHCGAFGQTGERYFCGAFALHGSAEGGWEGCKSYREAANMAGQAVDKSGMVVLCADGNALTPHSGLDAKQQKILKMTKKPDQEAPSFFEGLFSGTANANAVQAEAAQRSENYLKSLKEQRKKETCSAKRALLDKNIAEETHGYNSPQAEAARARYNAMTQKNSATARKANNTDFGPLEWGAGALGLALLFNVMVGDLSDDLLEAAQSGHPESVAVILDQKDLSRDAVYENGDEALLLAVKNGEEEIARMLINAGANVNAIDTGSESLLLPSWKNTVLMLAVETGRTEIARMLINADADVNAKNRHRMTALMYAARDGHEEIVRLLIDAKADINARTDRSWSASTPLTLAAEKGHAETVQILLDAGADLSDSQSLWLAARRGNTDVVQTLLDTLYKKNILTDRYITPALSGAVEYGHRGVVQILKKAREKVIEKQPSAPEKNKTASLARSFTVTGVSCEVRGDVINISAGRDASTYPLPQGCALLPQVIGTGM